MSIADLITETLEPNALQYQTLERTAEFFHLDDNLKQQIFGLPTDRDRLQRDDEILNPLVVDRFNRFNRITQQAIGLFEDTDKALQWLQTAKNSLAGITPLAALSTDEGAKQVEEILYRTEYGIYG